MKINEQMNQFLYMLRKKPPYKLSICFVDIDYLDNNVSTDDYLVLRLWNMCKTCPLMRAYLDVLSTQTPMIFELTHNFNPMNLLGFWETLNPELVYGDPSCKTNLRVEYRRKYIGHGRYNRVPSYSYCDPSGKVSYPDENMAMPFNVFRVVISEFYI
jgi:hypothetical protein